MSIIAGSVKWNLVHAYGANCPTWPVKVNGLDFGPVWIPLGIHTGLGRKLVRLGIGSLPQGSLPHSKVQSRDSDANVPRIEDLTQLSPSKGVFGPGTSEPLVRIYRLTYAHTDRGSDSTVDIVCGGHPGYSPPGLRGCSTSPGYIYEGFSVAYTLSQTDLPVPVC